MPDDRESNFAGAGNQGSVSTMRRYNVEQDSPYNIDKKKKNIRYIFYAGMLFMLPGFFSWKLPG